MKPNFKCQKCKRMITVGKKLKGTTTCQYCKHSMVITKEQLRQGYMPDLKPFQ